jgi:multimeric flavodoxin WrbA
MPDAATFDDLRAVFINGSIKKDKTGSHTQFLIDKAAGIMEHEGVTVDHIYALDYPVAFGMVKDGAENGQPNDEWPGLQKRILDADILVLATPIWLGAISSVTSLGIERLYAYSGDRNDKGQYVYYGRVGGCMITGNEDGMKHCARDILFSLQHMGYMIPPQADSGWVGEAGPGQSYGDIIKGTDKRTGFDNDFTNRNVTFMAWNLMHGARMLKDAGGWPAVGNTTEGWKDVANAKDPNPEYR